MAKRKPIAVLRVAELTTTSPPPREQAVCVGMVKAVNGKTHIYSTGILEFAVRRYSTYVLSSRTRIAPFDKWWAMQIPDDHVVLTDDHSVGEEEFFKLLPWHELYRRLRLPWPGHLNLMRVLANLRMHGILLGDEVRTNMSLQGNPFREDL